MPRPQPAVPTYRHHKPRNLAFVVLDGRKVYLGRHGSPASREKYARIVRETAAGRPAATGEVAPPVDPSTVTVAAVLAAFWTHAKTVYPYDPAYEGRRPKGELGSYHDVMRPVLKLFASTPAVEFGPKALRLVQDEMVAMDWCRNVINRSTVRIRTIFKWASGEGELLAGEVYARLRASPGLRTGQRGVRSTPPVKAVPLAAATPASPAAAGTS